MSNITYNLIFTKKFNDSLILITNYFMGLSPDRSANEIAIFKSNFIIYYYIICRFRPSSFIFVFDLPINNSGM